jgi:8-oxo-dGDP phosphatase
MAADFTVVSRTTHLTGSIFSVVTDQIRMPDGDIAARDYIRGHVGAVAVVPYHEQRDQVLLVHQYRHPLGRYLWELPAGLRDVEGEPLVKTAARELAEEADLSAQHYHVLLDLALSPGCSDEVIRVFLARDLAEIPYHARHTRHAEEATMTTHWFNLDQAITMALAGEIENATCVAGLLATTHARNADWNTLRLAASTSNDKIDT